jgi:hypothetical protein
MKPKKQFFRKALIVIASVSVTLLFAEVALRYFAPIYTANIPWSYEYEAKRGIVLSPASHLFRSIDFQQESRVNKLGTSNFQESFEGYEKLVFAVGDSHTQGTGVAADMSYPFQLDLELNRDEQGLYVKRYAVVNLGVGGYGGEQSLLGLQDWTLKLGRPSIILYMGCENDFDDDLMFKTGIKHGVITRGSPGLGSLGGPLRWLKNETQLGLRVFNFFNERKKKQLREEAVGKMGSGAASASIAELESEELEMIAAAAHEYGARLIVSWSDEGASYEWLKSWASKRGIGFGDWAARTNSVRAVMPALPLNNNHSSRHHRGWTNRIIAEEFARLIRANQN